LSLVATIKVINEQIKQLERQIATAIREHPDGAIFRSLFKTPKSVICAAELLAEIGDCRARYPTRDTLAADAGHAADAIESGNAKQPASAGLATSAYAQFSATWRTPPGHHSPWAQDTYARARARGHDHPRAIRTLGRAWCRIRWRCWQDRMPYDPARHRALQQHITVTIPTPSGHPARPRCHPADGRRRRHPNGGPQGRARST
jgi:transposase